MATTIEQSVDDEPVKHALPAELAKCYARGHHRLRYDGRRQLEWCVDCAGVIYDADA